MIGWSEVGVGEDVAFDITVVVACSMMFLWLVKVGVISL